MNALLFSLLFALAEWYWGLYFKSQKLAILFSPIGWVINGHMWTANGMGKGPTNVLFFFDDRYIWEMQTDDVDEAVATFNLYALICWRWLGRSRLTTMISTNRWFAITDKIFNGNDWVAWQAYFEDELAVVYVDIPEYLGVPPCPRNQKLCCSAKKMPYIYDAWSEVWAVGFLIHNSERFGWKVIKEFHTRDEAVHYYASHLFLTSGN